MLSLRIFKIVAITEAASWTGLVVGMVFKHVLAAGDAGVAVFGPIHGFLFIGYVVTALFAAIDGAWSRRTTLYVLALGVPPLASLLAHRHVGKLPSNQPAVSEDRPS